MKIGYLHIGPAKHGIRRYSQYIANEAHQRPDLDVIESSVTLTSDWQSNREALVSAVQQLSMAEVIHFQYNGAIWGGKFLPQIYHLWIFFSSCSCPLLVTLHDIYVERKYSHGNDHRHFIWKSLIKYIRSVSKLEVLILHYLLSKVQKALLCTREEEKRLRKLLNGRMMNNIEKISVVPHFVEKRTITVDQTSTCINLGLDKVKTVTLLGWIYPGKGHRLALEAMPNLPSNVKLIFAGQPSDGCEWLAEELFAVASALGVEDRLQITGYLTEEELEQYLIATDLAICPFETFSASGSLSTWISIGRPILASDLPQISEYNCIEPRAINTFKPYTTSSLAQAVRQLLPTCIKSEEPAVIRLRQKLVISEVFDKHLVYYHQLLHSCSQKPNEKVMEQV